MTLIFDNAPGLKRITVEDTIMRLAKEAGAEYPAIAECSDGKARIVDMASGTVYEIELRELK